MLGPCGISVERLRGGEPIVAPNGEGWESGHTYNAATVRLGPDDRELIAKLVGQDLAENPALADGAVAILYRAQPQVALGTRAGRSSVGLAVCTPDLELLRRYPRPVIAPTEDPHGDDYHGVEDPRVTRFGDTFYLVYCGYTRLRSGRDQVQVCLARSRDLLHWEKLGPAKGDVNCCQNKDGVLLPDRLDGQYVLLHRPMSGHPSGFSIELATSDSLEGEWRNRGKVLSAPPHPACAHSWVGAGSVPLPLGGGRYLVIYHTGHRLRTGPRQYNADAAIFDFDRFDSKRPARIVESALERVIVPETVYELSDRPGCPDPLHCVFPCGSYERDGDLHLVYGGRDAYVLAARVRKAELLDRLEHCRLS